MCVFAAENWLVGYDKTGYQLSSFPANNLSSVSNDGNARKGFDF